MCLSWMRWASYVSADEDGRWKIQNASKETKREVCVVKQSGRSHRSHSRKDTVLYKHENQDCVVTANGSKQRIRAA